MTAKLAQVIALDDVRLLRACVTAHRQRQRDAEPVTRRGPNLRRPARARRRRADHRGQLDLFAAHEAHP